MNPEKLEVLLREADASSDGASTLPAETIIQRAKQSASSRRRLRLIPLGIAAVLMLGVGAMWMLVSGARSAAAEELLAAVKTTQSYKGWIHLVFTWENEPVKTARSAIHANATVGVVGEEDPGLGITFRSALTKLGTHFDPASKKVQLFEIDPVEVQQAAVFYSRVTSLEGLIKAVKDDSKLTHVEKKTENGLDHFTITDADEETGAAGLSEAWVDPKSGFIVKSRDTFVDRFRKVNRTLVTMISFGAPEIHDIYDLGVPRDSVVEDQRPPKQIRDVLDRVDDAIIKGVGDGVLVRTTQRRGNSPGDNWDFLDVYGSRGKTFFEFRYGGSRNDVVPADVLGPKGWPKPSIADLLTFVAHNPLQGFFISDSDERCYSGYYDSEKHVYSGTWQGRDNQTEMPDWTVSHWERLSHAPAYQMWIGRHAIGLLARDARSEVLVEPLLDDKQPTLLGIRLKSENGIETWLDTARNDIPTAWTETRSFQYARPDPTTTPPSATTVGRVKVEIRQRKYLEYAQLPDGRWYPSHWEETRDVSNKDSGRPTGSTHYDVRLMFDPKVQLPDSWFTDPVKRKTREPGGL